MVCKYRCRQIGKIQYMYKSYHTAQYNQYYFMENVEKFQQELRFMHVNHCYGLHTQSTFEPLDQNYSAQQVVI